ncbi:MAG TPA: hypothetical protein VH619_09015, partial [Verrucomicrobiae bacterium]|nr:hypothetical protein [Verrucomicrobiae bacterium]
LSVTIDGPGTTSLTNNQYLVQGSSYSITATPKKGDFFFAWTEGLSISRNAAISFTMTSGMAITAIFVSNALPNALSITYPVANSQLTTNNFTLTGKIAASVANPQITYQIFSNAAAVNLPQGALITGTNWSVPLSLSPGTYSVVAVASDSSGRHTMASETFKINMYPNIAGNYYGIFLPTNNTPFATNVTTDLAGYFSVTLSSSGMMSGSLQFPLRTFSLPFQLPPSGNTGILEGYGFDGTSGPLVYFDIAFDLTNGTDTATGWVFWLGTFSPVTLYRAATKLPTNTVAGKYILNFATITNQTGSGPTNDGYATLSIAPGGTLTLGGTLADNSTFSRTTGVSKNGIWPVYAPLYSGGGMLIGWETNVIGSATNTAGSTGVLYWLKSKNTGTYFAKAFTLVSSSTGTNYVAPPNGSQYNVVFSGGTVTTPLTNLLTVKLGKLVPAASAPDRLTITLGAAGGITGTIYNPAHKVTLSIRGSFNNPSIGGSGFILDTDGQSDPFYITPVP